MRHGVATALHPAVLLKRYLKGSLGRMQSSSRLERETLHVPPEIPDT
jgi:hypothetical protein